MDEKLYVRLPSALKKKAEKATTVHSSAETLSDFTRIQIDVGAEATLRRASSST